MGSWNPVQMYNIPSFWQGPVAQTGMSLLANMALAKFQQNMKTTAATEALNTAKATKPENVPEGMYSYWDGSDWKVTSKPKKAEPYGVVSSGGRALGILDKQTGTVSTVGFDKQDVLPADVNISKDVNSKGKVTWTAHHKVSGDRLWTSSEKGIGREGKTAEGTQVKIDRAVDTAVEKQRETPGKLYNAALGSLTKSLSLREEMELKQTGKIVYNKGTPQEKTVTRGELLLREMGKQANITDKYPTAVMGEVDGKWMWAVQKGGQWFSVLDEHGMKDIK